MNTTNTSTDAQRICDHCNTPYEPGALYCNNCGCILPEVTSGSAHTTYLGAIERQRTDLEWGTAYFHVRAQLQLQLKSSKKFIPVPLDKGSIVVGRQGENGEEQVDLTDYGALDLGVSRQHVRILRIQDGLQIFDLGSANGTYLNRVRLVAGQPQVLRNHAILQLGQMVLRVQFV